MVSQRSYRTHTTGSQKRTGTAFVRGMIASILMLVGLAACASPPSQAQSFAATAPSLQATVAATLPQTSTINALESDNADQTSTPTVTLSGDVMRQDTILRQEPKAISAIIGSLCTGDSVTILSQQKATLFTYYQVRVESLNGQCDRRRAISVGAQGWVYDRSVQTTSVVPTATPTQAPTNTPSPTATPAAPIGQAIQAGDYQWNVLEVTDEGTILQRSKPNEPYHSSDGRFVRVRFSITNLTTSDKSHARVNDNLRMVDDQERAYAVRDDLYSVPLSEDAEDCSDITLLSQKPRICEVFFIVGRDPQHFRLQVTNLALLLVETAYIDLGSFVVLPPDTPTPTPLPVTPTTVPNPVAPSNSGVRVGAICGDGTRSYATGRGACSHHGGVDHWLYQ